MKGAVKIREIQQNVLQFCATILRYAVTIKIITCIRKMVSIPLTSCFRNAVNIFFKVLYCFSYTADDDS